MPHSRNAALQVDAVTRLPEMPVSLADQGIEAAASISPSETVKGTARLLDEVARLPDVVINDLSRSWYLDRAAGGDASFNISAGLEFAGPIDLERLESEALLFVSRQPMLRLSFPAMGGTFSFAPARIARPLIETIDLRQTDNARQEAQALVCSASEKPFDVERGPLFRLMLFRLPGHRMALVMLGHHLICDLKSIVYTLASIVMPALDISLPSRPERKLLPKVAKVSLDSAVSFWRRQLTGVEWASPFRAGDLEPGRRHVGPASPRLDIEISETAFSALRAVANAALCGVSVAALTAIQLTLALATGRQQITVLFPMQLPAGPDKVCNSASPFPVTCRIDADRPAREVFRANQASVAAISSYADSPISEIAAKLGAEAGFRHPGVLVSFGAHLDVLGHFPAQFAAEPWPMMRSRTDLDLAMWFAMAADGRSGSVSLQWRSDVVSDHVPTLMFSAWNDILARIAADGTVSADALAELPSVRALAAGLRRPSLRIASSFVAEPIIAPLSGLSALVAQPADVSFGGFDQVLQDLITPDGLLQGNGRGANIVLLRLEDRINNTDRSGDGLAPKRLAATLDQAVSDHVAAFRAAMPRMKVPTVLVLCPPTGFWADIPALATLRARAEARLLAELADLSGLSILAWSDIDALYAPARLADAGRERLAHIPYTDETYAAIAAAIVRRRHELTRPPVKVVVVDCDNTLWSGAVGEEGPAGVRFHAGHLALQSRLAAASRAGILVCLCSKNIEDDVAAVFAQRGEMALGTAHIAAMRVNWQPKSENIRALAAELSLGLDSFVFLDDNPVEISEVSRALPEVICLQVPEAEADLAGFARHLWLLDKHGTTEEDRRRTAMYQETAQRQTLRRTTGDYAAFIASLDLKVTPATITPATLARLAQLTQRTNQFNIDPKPLTEAEVRARLDDPDVVVEALDVADRFGAYGLVGLIIAHKKTAALEVETLLMSCRVLGRGVEHHMIAALGRAALAAGLSTVRLPVRSTARNIPVRRFLEHVPAQRTERPEGALLELDAQAAADFRFTAEVGEADLAAYERETGGEGSPTPVTPATDRAAGLQEIATHLTVASAILRRFGDDKRASEVDTDSTAARLLMLVGQIAERRDLTLDMAILDIGLDSLSLVSCLALIQERFGVVLGVEHFLRSPTLADLANVIDHGGMLQESAEDPDLPLIERDLLLPHAIVPVIAAPPRREVPQDIFLTGATGFLGGFLLREIIERSHARVHCLVRGKSDGEAATRLAAALSNGPHAGLAKEVGSRLIAISGDVSLPDFGLSAERFSRLQQDVDLVLHNAAAVNFIAPYEELRRTNVEGTRTALRLAAHGRPKSLHFISTVAVAGADSFLGVERVRPDELPETAGDVMLGYGRTKWVAERNLGTARARGLPVTIYRPGNISGDSKTGYWPAGDALTRLIQGFARVGAMPDIPIAIDFTPVDYAAAAIVGLLLKKESENHNFHIVHPDPVTSERFAGWARSRGLIDERLPMPDFLTRLNEAVRADPKMPIAAILPLFSAKLGRLGLSFIELVAWRPEFDTTATRALLADAGVDLPEINETVFDSYAAGLRSAGYL